MRIKSSRGKSEPLDVAPKRGSWVRIGKSARYIKSQLDDSVAHCRGHQCVPWTRFEFYWGMLFFHIAFFFPPLSYSTFLLQDRGSRTCVVRSGVEHQPNNFLSFNLLNAAYNSFPSSPIPHYISQLQLTFFNFLQSMLHPHNSIYWHIYPLVYRFYNFTN